MRQVITTYRRERECRRQTPASRRGRRTSSEVTRTSEGQRADLHVAGLVGCGGASKSVCAFSATKRAAISSGAAAHRHAMGIDKFAGAAVGVPMDSVSEILAVGDASVA
ncbi:MAG: hypothetical protein IPP62_16185 [bacterium]|nr:hypothetical protein [bacterium]